MKLEWRVGTQKKLIFSRIFWPKIKQSQTKISLSFSFLVYITQKDSWVFFKYFNYHLLTIKVFLKKLAYFIFIDVLFSVSLTKDYFLFILHLIVCFDGLLFSQQRFTELALAVDITRNYSINFYIFLELAPKTLVSFLIRVVFFIFIDCIILFMLCIKYMLCYLYIIFKSVF